MTNPLATLRTLLRHPMQPDAAAMHALQVQRLRAELDAARLTIASLQADNEQLRAECAEAVEKQAIYYGLFCDHCKAGGKHQ